MDYRTRVLNSTVKSSWVPRVYFLMELDAMLCVYSYNHNKPTCKKKIKYS